MSCMNVSPLDLRQQKFRQALRGFDKVEVTSFLLAVADDYEQALRETDRLRQDVARMEALLGEHREQDRGLKTTLMAAQRLAGALLHFIWQGAALALTAAIGFGCSPAVPPKRATSPALSRWA